MMQKWLNSLKSQLLFRAITLLAILLILIGTVQYWLVKQFLYDNRAETLQAQLNIIQGRMFDPNRPNKETVMLAATNNDFRWQHDSAERNHDHDFQDPLQTETIPNLNGPLQQRYVLADTSLAYRTTNGKFTDYAESGSLEAPQLNDAQYRDIQQQLDQNNPVHYRLANVNRHGEQLLVFARVNGNSRFESGLVQLGVETKPLQSVILQQLTIFICLSLVAILIGVFLYLSVVRRTLKPLSRVVHAVKQTDAGNLSVRIPTAQGQLEIDKLSESFNGMLERLEISFATERAAMEKMRQFIADASHELRTPMTSIHGFLEVLLRGAATRPAQLEAALKSMYTESKRMNKLVEDLLTLAKLDREPTLQLQPVNLCKLMQDMKPQLDVLANSRTVIVQCEPLIVPAEADRMKQVILNLFHNAVQHTTVEQGEITIRLYPETDELQHHWAIVTVTDNGTGIDPSQLSRLFERFYRVDSSRTRQYGGAGLGLSISQSIIVAHGGTIEATSEIGVGSTFIVRLPLVPQHKTVK